VPGLAYSLWGLSAYAGCLLIVRITPKIFTLIYQNIKVLEDTCGVSSIQPDFLTTIVCFIVIAVVHWRFALTQLPATSNQLSAKIRFQPKAGSRKLEATLTFNVPAPDKRHPVYSAFRLSTELCF